MSVESLLLKSKEPIFIHSHPTPFKHVLFSLWLPILSCGIPSFLPRHKSLIWYCQTSMLGCQSKTTPNHEEILWTKSQKSFYCFTFWQFPPWGKIKVLFLSSLLFLINLSCPQHHLGGGKITHSPLLLSMPVPHLSLSFILSYLYPYSCYFPLSNQPLCFISQFSG